MIRVSSGSIRRRRNALDETEHIIPDTPLHRDRLAILQLRARQPAVTRPLLEPAPELLVLLGHRLLLYMRLLRERLAAVVVWQS